MLYTSFPDGSEVKASAANAGDPGSIPGSGRSPGEGNGNPLQYSCLENPIDWGAWWAAVHGVTKSRTGLSDFTYLFKSQVSVVIIIFFLVSLQTITSLKRKKKFWKFTSIFPFLSFKDWQERNILSKDRPSEEQSERKWKRRVKKLP